MAGGRPLFHLGPCGTADAPGDCTAGAKGSWTLNKRQAHSWESAAAACERWCAACDRCRFFSFSPRWRDCSWFHACDLGALRHDVPGFLSAAAANATTRLQMRRGGDRRGGGGGGGGGRGGRGGRGGGRRRALPLRTAAWRHAAAPTPERRVPVHAGDLLTPLASAKDAGDGTPAAELAEVDGAAASVPPLAWSHTPVFWPDELEQGPCFRVPAVVQARGASLPAADARRAGPPARACAPGARPLTTGTGGAWRQAADGALVAFAEARRGSCLDADAHQIAARISADGGRSWGAAFTAAGNESYWVGNPAAVALASGRLLLLMAVHSEACAGQCVAANALSHSDDGGRRWSAARELRAAGVPPGRTGPGLALQLRAAGPRPGRVLVPVAAGTYGGVGVLASDDEGRSWRAAAARLPRMDEAQLAQLPNGSLALLMRHRAERGRGKALALSHDGGDSFGALGFEPRLRGPVCQASLASDGARLYYSGPSDTAARRALVVRRSAAADGAAGALRWDAERSIDPGEAGYSCLVLPLARGCGAGAPACGGVLYEAERMVIRFATFPLAF